MTSSQQPRIKVRVFVNTQPVFIGLVHCPNFRKLNIKSTCMPGSSYSTCRQCHDAPSLTKVWLISHAVLEAVSTTRCFR